MGVTPVVVAVDGGGSKTDAWAVTLDGAIVRQGRIGTTSPQVLGVPASVAAVDGLVQQVAGGADVRTLAVYLAGLDLPRELVAYRAALPSGWPALLLDNDIFAVLRAGTAEPDAVAVVCGTGMNAVGRRADGALVRFPALGTVSGDWGGGSGLGAEALWHAARHEDGRGPATVLTEAVCSRFAVSSIGELIEQLHVGRRDGGQLAGLAPDVFAAAEAGDRIATALVDRQADEIVTLAEACLRRLHLLSSSVPVVLGGGIVQARPPVLMGRLDEQFAARTPHAHPEVLTAPPVLGAALLGVEAAGAKPSALRRLHDENRPRERTEPSP